MVERWIFKKVLKGVNMEIVDMRITTYNGGVTKRIAVLKKRNLHLDSYILESLQNLYQPLKLVIGNVIVLYFYDYCKRNCK